MPIRIYRPNRQIPVFRVYSQPASVQQKAESPIPCGSIMGSYANVLTPRHTHKLWTNNTLMLGRKGASSKGFTPTLLFSGPYVPPPPPRPPKKPEPPKAQTVRESELLEMAAALRAEAAELESASQAANAAANLKIQLGLLLLSKEDYIKRLLKDWDTKGKGEFLRGEFRLNLRNASSVPRLTSGDLAKRASGATLCDAAARCLASMAPCVK